MREAWQRRRRVGVVETSGRRSANFQVLGKLPRALAEDHGRTESDDLFALHDCRFFREKQKGLTW